MSKIDWEFEKEVLQDCWSDGVFRVMVYVVGALVCLVVLRFFYLVGMGDVQAAFETLFYFFGAALITFFVLQAVRR